MGTYGTEGAGGATDYVSTTDLVADLVWGTRRWITQALATPSAILKQNSRGKQDRVERSVPRCAVLLRLRKSDGMSIA
jgi:hypothetical protein